MEEITLNNELEYGEILYEKSNAKSIYDAPTGKVGAKGWAQRIYMLLLGAGLLGWFVYSLVNAASDVGFVKALVNHLAAFFVLLVCETILLLSAFGGWGRFARGALKHKALTRKHRMEGVRTRQLEEELKTADENKAKENAIRIYRNCVEIVNNGERTVLQYSQLQRVQCQAQATGYQLTFVTYDGEIVANMLLPVSDLPLVKKHFDHFDYTPVDRSKGYLRKKFPLLAFAFIPLIIGIALTVIHCLVLPDMPLVFGLVFMLFGVMFVTVQFNDVAVIRHGVTPIGFGLILTALPLGVLFTIVDLAKELTLTDLLTTFTPAHAGLGLFLGFGPMVIIMGIAGIVDCTRM